MNKVGICLLALLTLTACRPDEPAPAAQARAALPTLGASWVAGNPEKPESGRLIVGLLLERPPSLRFARLIRKERMQAFLEAEKAGKPLIARDFGIYDGDQRDPAGVSWATVRHRLLPDVVKRFKARFPQVDLEFRQVLPDECANLPLVLDHERDPGKREARDLAPWQATGGILLRARSSGALAAPKFPWPDLERHLEKAMVASPLVTRLASDPLRIVAATRKGEHVHVTFADPNVSAYLGSLEGGLITEGRPNAAGQHVFHSPDPAIDPYQAFVVALYEQGDVKISRSSRLVDLVGTLERHVRLGTQARIGGVLAARVRYTNAKTKAGISGIKSEVRLRQGERVLGITRSTSNAQGHGHVQLVVPADAAPGSAVLDFGDQRFPLTILPDLRVSVVTDRTLYRQTDKIHARIMVQRAGDGHPVGETEVDLVLGDIKKKVKTSAHGIASTTIDITEMRPGRKALRARVRGMQVATAFNVRAYERPTFTVELDPVDGLALDPGQEAPVRLKATYVNGSPLIGGKVIMSVRKPFALSTERGRTDETGSFSFSVHAKPGPLSRKRIPIDIQVRDAENRWQDVRLILRHETAAPTVQVVALTDVVFGEPARIAVRSEGYEGLRFLRPDGTSVPVALDEQGRGVVTATFRGPATEMTFVDAAGTRVSRSLEVGLSRDPKRPLLLLENRVARVGGALEGAVLGPEGTAVIDLWRGATLVRALEVELENGRGRFWLPLDDLSVGTLQVRTSMLGDHSHLAATQSVLIARSDALDVDLSSKSSTWRPGSTAEIDVSVRDALGDPTGCVLGYYGVDEALLALTPMSDGYEDVFSVTGTDASDRALARTGRSGAFPEHRLLPALQRTFKIAGRRPDSDQLRTRTKELEVASKQRATEVFRKQTAKLEQAYVDVWKKAPLASLRTSHSRRESLQWAVRGGWLDPNLMIDPWGRPLEVVVPGVFDIYWLSAGPDGRTGTPDDLMKHWPSWDWYDQIPPVVHRFLAFVRAEVKEHGIPSVDEAVEDPIITDEEISDQVETDNDLPVDEDFEEMEGLSDAPFEGPATNGTIGIGGGSGGAFRGRGGFRDAGPAGGGTKYRPPQIRRDFNPTLCFVPELIIGPSGKTTLEIPLKDSITTWRMRLIASRGDGAVGIGEGKLRVSQPLHLGPWLPRHVTVGDEWDLPVAVRNELPEAVTATLSLYTDEQIEIVAEKHAVVEIGPRGTGAVTFHLKAVRAGRCTVGLRGDTGASEDQVERIVHVHPNAQAIVTTHTGNLASAMPFKGSVLPRAGDLRLELCPTALTELVSGFEGLIRCPHG